MYKITFKMESPLVSSPFRPTLDALLGAALELGRQEGTLDLVDRTGCGAAWQEDDGVKLPFCSSMFFDETNGVKDSQFWVKRFPSEMAEFIDWQGKTEKVNLGSGGFKNYKMPMETLVVPEVWFYFESGNLDKIKLLVEHYLFNIGKKGSQGFGKFNDYRITSIDHSVASFDTKILRPIPMRFLEVWSQNANDSAYLANKNSKRRAKIRRKGALIQLVKETQYTAWKAPYWQPSNMELCAVPN